MYYSFLMFLLRFPLYAASASAAVALAGSGQTTLYQIDAGVQGTSFYNQYYALLPGGKPINNNNPPEVAFQTSLQNPSSFNTYKYATYGLISNGLIRYIQNVYRTTYNTLLIVSYQTSGNQPEYIVVPVEQLIDLIYFPSTSFLPTSSSPFNASYLSGVVPYFSVDPSQRAMDIVYTVGQLQTTFKTSSSNQVWIQTGVNGPFNPNLPVPGLLQNIQSIAYNNGMLQITFQTNHNGSITQTVYVSPEQVQQIIWIRNFNTPSLP